MTFDEKVKEIRARYRDECFGSGDLTWLLSRLELARKALKKIAKVNSPDDLLYENIARRALDEIEGEK